MNLALHAIQQSVAGAAVLQEWLGAGGAPESQHVADSRAQICLECPKHRPEHWWSKYFTDPIAQVIRRHLEVKNQIGLKVFCEDKLGMCAACGCSTGLKVWCPIKHIKSHTTPEALEKYDLRCWVRSEIESS